MPRIAFVVDNPACFHKLITFNSSNPSYLPIKVFGGMIVVISEKDLSYFLIMLFEILNYMIVYAPHAVYKLYHILKNISHYFFGNH